jgi:hypothetical protein
MGRTLLSLETGANFITFKVSFLGCAVCFGRHIPVSEQSAVSNIRVQHYSASTLKLEMAVFLPNIGPYLQATQNQIKNHYLNTHRGNLKFSDFLQSLTMWQT